MLPAWGLASQTKTGMQINQSTQSINKCLCVECVGVWNKESETITSKKQLGVLHTPCYVILIYAVLILRQALSECHMLLKVPDVTCATFSLKDCNISTATGSTKFGWPHLQGLSEKIPHVFGGHNQFAFSQHNQDQQHTRTRSHTQTRLLPNYFFKINLNSLQYSFLRSFYTCFTAIVLHSLQPHHNPVKLGYSNLNQ